MEKYQTKNRIYNSILIPIVVHLEKSMFNVQSDEFLTLENKIKSEWDLIKKSHTDDEYIDSIVIDYVRTFNSIKNKKQLNESEWLNYVELLHNMLLKFDESKINCVNKHLNDCQKHIKIFEYSNSLNIKTWFKEFCQYICSCISLLQVRRSEILSDTDSNQILLHIIQLTSCSALMFELLDTELKENIIVTESRKFLIKRFISCLDGIRKIINDNHFEECHSPGFIQWMDNVLDLISIIEPSDENLTKNIENTKNAIEEVLCHAMSLAHISSDEDSKIIKGTIQTILHEFGELEKECNDPSLCNLYADIVSDNLCLLERRVNTSILNMSLKVFSEYSVSLEQLIKTCQESNTSILSRSEDDLDDLITNFDGQVDCIMQVGLFAIACSTNTIIIAKIRSSLASLECLECELVPALTTLYMEPSKISNIHAMFLIRHWYHEVKTLRKNVCFIIDPVAFGQLVQEHYQTVLITLKEYLLKEESILTVDQTLYPICKRTEVFKIVAIASIKDMKIKQTSVVHKQFDDFINVYSEVCSAINKLTTYPTREFSLRVLKRIEILLTMIKRLVKSFSESEQTKMQSTQDNTTLHESTLKNKKKEISKVINISEFETRGQQLLKDRSILYKTPNATKIVLPIVRPTKLSKLRESPKMRISFGRKITISESNITNLDKTFDLEITKILDGLRNEMNKLVLENI